MNQDNQGDQDNQGIDVVPMEHNSDFEINLDATQKFVLDWAKKTFGDIASKPLERSRRFAEEAVEVLQATNMSKEEVLRIVDWVYSRPQALSINSELGGCLLTLLALAEFHNASSRFAISNEIQRLISIPQEEWDRRHQAKVEGGIAQ